jgi:two-component system, OmpR family, response regulator
VSSHDASEAMVGVGLAATEIVVMTKILVIDDEQGIRDLLDVLLRRKGYDVVVAENGQEGLKVFRRERPDVVVLDLNMPGIDGLTVLQQIRSLDPHKPVIILTGAGTPEAEQQVRALGVTEFVEKEFSLHRLGDSLKRLLIDPDPVA